MYTNKEIWNVTYPIFLGLLAQNVINVTDTAFLGHVGEVALGAAAMGGLLYICIYTVAFGFSVGSQILIARRNGEGNFHAVGPIMWQGSTFSFGMGVALLILMSLCAEPLIRLLITSDTISMPRMSSLPGVSGAFCSHLSMSCSGLSILASPVQKF